MNEASGGPAAAGAAGAAVRVPALLVMHAGLADALLRAAAKVYGPVDDVRVLSNEGLSRDALSEAVTEAAQGWARGGLVLTDFWGGSCHQSGVAASRACRGVVILTGVNMPMLLDYLHNRDHYDTHALAERLQQKGRESIRVQHGQQA